MTGPIPRGPLRPNRPGDLRRTGPPDLRRSVPTDLRRNLVFFAAVLLTVLVLLTLDAHHDDAAVQVGLTQPAAPTNPTGATTPLDPARQAVAAVLGPVQTQVAAGRATFVGYSRAFTDPAHTSAQLRRLQAENVRLTAQAAAARDRAAAAGQLTRIDRIAGAAHMQIAAGRVVALGPGQGFQHTVTVSLGSADGVARHAAVVADGGLVGRVIGVAPHMSTVLLLCDVRSAVGVRVGTAGQLAIARGTGNCAAPLQVTELAVGPAPTPGTTVTTWGSAWSIPYPPGLPVGRITGVGADALSLTPAAAPGSLDVVGVVVTR